MRSSSNSAGSRSRTAESGPAALAPLLRDRVAHELRTPLSVISQHADVLRAGLLGPVSPAQQLHLGEISQRVTDLDVMLDELFALEELNSSAARVWRRPLDLSDLLGAQRAAWGSQAERRQVSLEIEPAHVLPSVYGDERHVVRAMRSLVHRAIFAADAGTELALSLHFDPVRQMVLFDVQLGTSSSRLELPHDWVRAEDHRCALNGSAIAEIDQELKAISLSAVQAWARANFGELRLDVLGRGGFQLGLPVAEPRSLLARLLECDLRASSERVLLLWAEFSGGWASLAMPPCEEFLQSALGADGLVWPVGAGEFALATRTSATPSALADRVCQAWQTADGDWPLLERPSLRVTPRGQWIGQQDRLALGDAWHVLIEGGSPEALRAATNSVESASEDCYLGGECLLAHPLVAEPELSTSNMFLN